MSVVDDDKIWSPGRIGYTWVREGWEDANGKHERERFSPGPWTVGVDLKVSVVNNFGTSMKAASKAMKSLSEKLTNVPRGIRAKGIRYK